MTATSEISLLEQHPLSAAFPSMPEQEIEALALDIETHGQREPGVLFEGMVLDGWHRYLACGKAGVEFKANEFDGADPRAFVISQNLHRRHLSSSQRAAAVVKCHEWRANGVNSLGNVPSPAPGARDGATNAEMAKEADVGERTIVQAKRAEEAGLGDAVREGQISVKDAARMAKGEAPTPKTKPTDDAKARAELIDLQGQYADLLEKNAALSDLANELNDKLEAFETTEPDEQQKLIAELQLKVRRKDAEIDRLRVQIRDANNKNNVLIREVKMLQRRAGVGQ